MSEHAIAIARVSSGKQREEDQRPGLVSYAERKGYVLDEVVSVHGRSAFHGRHAKAILKAVEDYVRNGRSTVVIFRHVDRMARMEPEDGMRFFLKIRDAGARIEFSEQEFLNDKFELLGIYLKAAHEESKIKQSRKLQGNMRKRANGELVGRAPWGYDPVLRDGVQVNITPNALGRDWIPRIFNEVTNGRSLAYVTEMLRGIPSPQKNTLWDPATVRRIIANTSYYGAMEGNPNLKFEALIGVEVHKAANLAVESRDKRGRGSVKKPPTLLRPYCGSCWGMKREGAPSGMSPMYRTNSAKNLYYACKGHGPARKSCGGPVISVDFLDAEVERSMSERTDAYMTTEYVAGDDNDEQRAILDEKIKAAHAAGDYALMARLAQEAENIGPSERKSVIKIVDSGKTVGEHWQSLTLTEKRDELLKWTVVASPSKVTIFGPWHGEGRTIIGELVATE